MRQMILAVIALLAGCGSPIHHAAQNGDIAQLKRLLDAGADIENPHAVANSRPLVWATWSNKSEVVESLLDEGADPFARGDLGSAYDHAVEAKQPDIARVLADYAAVPGVGLAQRGAQIVVSAIVPGSPAQRAGISIGERLVAIDRRNVSDLTIRRARASLHKAAALTVQSSADAEPRTVWVSTAPRPPEADAAGAADSRPAAASEKSWWETAGAATRH